VRGGTTATVAWGSDGLRLAVERGDIPVIVDVLRFSSTVTTAVANGFTVLPAPTAGAAERILADCGAERRSLSPLDYVNPREPEEVILVSPNGAALAASLPPGTPGFIACFLNARTAGRLLSDMPRTGTRSRR
jgi:2-phosphosulfolactate phosphatase